MIRSGRPTLAEFLGGVLRDEGVSADLLPDGQTYRFPVVGSYYGMMVLMMALTEGSRCIACIAYPAVRSSPDEALTVETFEPIHVPVPLRATAVEFVARANWGMTLGGFELDMDGGSIRYRTTIDLYDEEPTAGAIRNLLYGCTRSLDAYLPALYALLDGCSPLTALARVEKKRA